MGMSDRIRQLDGISQCLIAMATELNLALLAELGFGTSTIHETTTADMIVAIRGDTAASVETASEWFDVALVERRVDPPDRTTGVEHRTLRSAVASVGANLAVVSLPGRHVVPEAVDAIRGGANVMIFSDGISLEDERRLKTLAQERGLMVMGPRFLGSGRRDVRWRRRGRLSTSGR